MYITAKQTASYCSTGCDSTITMVRPLRRRKHLIHDSRQATHAQPGWLEPPACACT